MRSVVTVWYVMIDPVAGCSTFCEECATRFHIDLDPYAFNGSGCVGLRCENCERALWKEECE